jgi:hypothetical protein
MQGGENMIGSRVKKISINEFPNPLQELLSDPIPPLKEIPETDDLWDILRQKGYSKKSDVYIIEDKDVPIFRASDIDINSNFIFTRHIKKSMLTEYPKNEIFLLIDFEIIKQDFRNFEHATEIITYWASQTTRKLKKFSPGAPKIIVKIIDNEQFSENSPLTLYREQDRGSLKKDRTPRVIVNCANLENHLNFSGDIDNDHPQFNVNYLTINSDMDYEKSQIFSISEKMDNGVLVISRDNSSPDNLRKILEMACVLAVSYTFSNKEFVLSNLPEQSYRSLKSLNKSKTGSMGMDLEELDRIYKEMPTSNLLDKLSSKWKDNGLTFFSVVSEFDNTLELLGYDCNCKIRHLFEVMEKSIDAFEDNILKIGDNQYDKIKEKRKIKQNYTYSRNIGLSMDKIKAKENAIKTLEKDSPLSSEDEKLVKRFRYQIGNDSREKNAYWGDLDPKLKNQIYSDGLMSRIKAKILERQSLDTKAQVEQIFYGKLCVDYSQRFSDDGDLLENIFFTYNEIRKLMVQFFSCKKISNSFHHVGVEERHPRDNELTTEERKLNLFDIHFNLVTHLELYTPLKEFLDFYAAKIDQLTNDICKNGSGISLAPEDQVLVLDHLKRFVGLELKENIQEEE